MQNLRMYGKPPFQTAVIHGGPGAPGEMAPVARQLADAWGVLEALQTATSLPGQVTELKTVLEKRADLPVTLIGFSWGAWLSFIVAARYPALVRKLILVGSGSFEEKYVAGLQERRLVRLSAAERTEAQSLLGRLSNLAGGDKRQAFARLGALFSKADAYNPLVEESEALDVQVDVYLGVWPAAAALRRRGELLALGRQIRCPVVAIHGDYDSHPAEGVQKPLSTTLADFRFILLPNCGHKPWVERQARDSFYNILREELRTQRG